MKLFTTKLLLLSMSVGIFNIVNSQDPPSGLISNWKMDETSGISLEDCTNGNNAACNFNLIPDVNGTIGIAQYFDFTNKAVIANNQAYNFPAHGSFTISYWMKFTETQYGLNGGQDHIIISKGDWQTGSPNGALWASGVNGSGKVNFLLSDDTGYKVDLEGADHYNDGRWHHVACVRNDETNESYLYADGEVVDYKYFDYTGSFTNTDSICIAHLMNLSQPQFYYIGSIDEIAIYNRALTYEEVNFLESAGIEFTGIYEIPNSVFSIYPVPASNVLNITFNTIVSESTAEIFNTTGNIIKSLKIPADKTFIGIPIEELVAGTYFCRIRNNDFDYSVRFLIIK